MSTTVLCTQGSLTTVQKLSIITTASSRRVSVHLPELFSPVFGVTHIPVVNSAYERVQRESECWLFETASLNARMKKIVRAANIGYCLSITCPDATPERLRVAFDWGNWVFPFDDLFDLGIVTEVAEAQRISDELLDTMSESPTLKTLEDASTLIQAHRSIYNRILDANSSVASRYKNAITRFSEGQVQQLINEKSESRLMTFDAVMDNRRLTVACEPVYPLLEHMYDLHIPDHVFDHWTIKKLQRIATDLVIIVNEIVSCRKEEIEGCPHNLVAVARSQGMSAQQAFDFVGDMLQERYSDWFSTVAALPDWGKEVNGDVELYVRSVKNFAIGNVHWSFNSTRYFGDMKDVVKQTMITDVMPLAPYDDVLRNHLYGEKITEVRD